MIKLVLVLLRCSGSGFVYRCQNFAKKSRRFVLADLCSLGTDNHDLYVSVHCRFYSNNSSFVHGGTDGRPDEQQAVTGQAVSIRHGFYTELSRVVVLASNSRLALEWS